MTWTNGLILGLGALLATMPIILHLLMQPKPKKMIFPALKFLKERQHATRSRMRLRHWLLLLMRCLLIALVALAMAGPTVASREFGNWLTLGGIGFSGLLVGIVLLAALFRAKRNLLLVGILATLLIGHVGYGGWSAWKLLRTESGEILGDGGAPIAALIVIDTSPRMQYRSDNQSRLEVAQEMALWLIRQFPLDSEVCVLATDNDRPFFSVDVAAASRRVETLETNFGGSSIPQSLSEGLKILEQASQDRKEVYVITDLTRQSWTGENSALVRRRLENDPSMTLFVIDVGVENPTNFSLASLDISSAEIAEQGDFSLMTQIQRSGSADQRTVRMVIEKPDLTRPVIRDGRAVFPTEILAEQTKTVDVRENATVAVPFQFSQRLPVGTYHGRVEIEGRDGLEIDNQRYFTVRVRPAWKVLVVHPANVSPRNLVSSIAPTLTRELGSASYDCQVIEQSELAAYERLTEFDAVFLLDPNPLEESRWQLLFDYANGGGGLGIFLGHNAASGSVADASFQTETARKVLAGELGVQWYSPDHDTFLSPQELSHPVFKSFRGIETGLLWNRFPVFLHWGIEPDISSNIDPSGFATGESAKDTANNAANSSEIYPTQTLLRYSNREPALIERQIGSGRVMVMTTPITERAQEENRRVWNELFIGKFLPAWMLVRAITANLVQADVASLNINTREVASFDNDLREFPEVYQVFTPREDRSPTPISTTADNRIRYRFTDQPGHYRLKGFLDGQPVLRGFSVNLEKSATDLTRVEPAELDTVLGPERYQMASAKEEIQRQQGTARVGQEFYPLLVLMVLVVLAVEYLMSNRFYAR